MHQQTLLLKCRVSIAFDRIKADIKNPIGAGLPTIFLLPNNFKAKISNCPFGNERAPITHLFTYSDSMFQY